MARATVQKEVSLTLLLTDYEAKFLHAVLQNPLPGEEDEVGTETYELRKAIWTELNETVEHL